MTTSSQCGSRVGKPAQPLTTGLDRADVGTLIHSPLTDYEVIDRCARARARYAGTVLHTKHLVADPETVCDRSPRAMRLRGEDAARLEVEAVVWEAAAEQRLFEGRLTDRRRAAERMGARR